uniref:Cytochrome c oxidase subunit 3 n=1 Tax=Hyalella tiwanaku TaxID=2759786 RepID=A0A7T8ZSF4_9CRUS|nr:cytochrome c oxidase subunit 3 [Hyalella tiwanaku]
MTVHFNHPYHLVEKSPWPLIASISAMIMVSGLVKWFHEFSFDLLLLGVMGILTTSAQWWRDASREASFQGLHTIKVVLGLRWGMLLFIVSEVLFFFSFFWAFFHSSLSSTMEIGSEWPPVGVKALNPFQIPLLNSAVLLSSGVTVTWAHHAILENNHSQSMQGLLSTVSLGVYFSALQGFEYLESCFSISDSIYGATFFVATGFHGAHVIIGSTFLAVNFYRLLLGHFSSSHHNGVEAAIWYWHFVDVVWLFLYVCIYWWGS